MLSFIIIQDTHNAPCEQCETQGVETYAVGLPSRYNVVLRHNIVLRCNFCFNVVLRYKVVLLYNVVLRYNVVFR